MLENRNSILAFISYRYNYKSNQLLSVFLKHKIKFVLRIVEVSWIVNYHRECVHSCDDCLIFNLGMAIGFKLST